MQLQIFQLRGDRLASNFAIRMSATRVRFRINNRHAPSNRECPPDPRMWTKDPAMKRVHVVPMGDMSPRVFPAHQCRPICHQDQPQI